MTASYSPARIAGSAAALGILFCDVLLDQRRVVPLKRLFEATKRHGLLIGKGGLFGNVVRIAPPLNVTKDQIDQALKQLDRSLAGLGR